MSSVGEIMSMYIMPDIGLELDVEYSGEGAGKFVVKGPKKKLDALMHVVQGLPNVSQIKGVIGPITPVTLPDDIKKQAGIPLPATKFAFLHPLKYFKSRQHRINLVLNPWSCVHLLGGFAYFDDDQKLLGVNALTIQPTASVLHLVGPTEPTREVVQAMRELGRMTDVVIEGLIESGFEKFGWINPGESPNGKTVAQLNPHVVMHGGFLYETSTGPVVYAITPVADPDTPLDTNGRLGKAIIELRKIIIADDREARRLRDQTSAHVLLARTMATAIVWLAGYLTIGCLVMCNVESWSIIDGIYFSMVSMSTVGYGDLHPTKPVSRAFTVVYIYLGIIAIFAKLAAVVSLITRPFITWGRKKLNTIMPDQLRPPEQRREDKSGVQVKKSSSLRREAAVAQSGAIFYAQNMIPSVILNLVLQFTSAFVFAQIENWDFGLALYHCLVTASTVGYGNPEIGGTTGNATPGRIWASFHIMLSVALLGDTISIVDELRNERSRELKRIQALNRKLDRPLLDNLNMRSAALRPDVNKTVDGITELEFVIGMCVELDMIDMDQIKPFIDQFRRLDLNGSGRVGMKDLRIEANNMANLSRLHRKTTTIVGKSPPKPAVGAQPKALSLSDKQWRFAISGAHLRTPTPAADGTSSTTASGASTRMAMNDADDDVAERSMTDTIRIWEQTTQQGYNTRKSVLGKLRLKSAAKVGPKAGTTPVAVPYPVNKPVDPNWKPLRAAVKLTSLSSGVSAFASGGGLGLGSASSTTAPSGVTPVQPIRSSAGEKEGEDDVMLTKVTPF